MLDISVAGGQAASTFTIENHPGTKGAIHGRELIDDMRKQAESFGAQIDDLKEMFEVKLTDETKYIRTEDTEYHAKAVIIASGASPRALPAQNADELKEEASITARLATVPCMKIEKLLPSGAEMPL